MREWHSQNQSRHRIRRGEKTQYFIPFFAVGDNRRQFAGSARSHPAGQAVLGKRGWSGRTVPVGLRLAVQTRGELTRAQRVVCLKRLVYPGTRRQILRVVVRLKLR